MLFYILRDYFGSQFWGFHSVVPLPLVCSGASWWKSYSWIIQVLVYNKKRIAKHTLSSKTEDYILNIMRSCAQGQTMPTEVWQLKKGAGATERHGLQAKGRNSQRENRRSVTQAFKRKGQIPLPHWSCLGTVLLLGHWQSPRLMVFIFDLSEDNGNGNNQWVLFRVKWRKGNDSSAPSFLSVLRIRGRATLSVLCLETEEWRRKRPGLPFPQNTPPNPKTAGSTLPSTVQWHQASLLHIGFWGKFQIQTTALRHFRYCQLFSKKQAVTQGYQWWTDAADGVEAQQHHLLKLGLICAVFEKFVHFTVLFHILEYLTHNCEISRYIIQIT